MHYGIGLTKNKKNSATVITRNRGYKNDSHDNSNNNIVTIIKNFKHIDPVKSFNSLKKKDQKTSVINIS